MACIQKKIQHTDLQQDVNIQGTQVYENVLF